MIPIDADPCTAHGVILTISWFAIGMIGLVIGAALQRRRARALIHKLEQQTTATIDRLVRAIPDDQIVKIAAEFDEPRSAPNSRHV